MYPFTVLFIVVLEVLVRPVKGEKETKKKERKEETKVSFCADNKIPYNENLKSCQ